MKRTQSGITLIGFIIVLAVVGLFAYVGMKLIPMYTEFYGVKKAMASLANEPGITQMDAPAIKDLFYRRMYINYAENVKTSDVTLTRKEAGWLMVVDYEVRRPVIANLDVVGKFHAEKELSRKVVGD
ncbi:DUF4845 domain-containing protein [Lysobacter rhizosphaerae]|jgi:hypothetical protein